MDSNVCAAIDGYMAQEVYVDPETWSMRANTMCHPQFTVAEPERSIPQLC